MINKAKRSDDMEELKSCLATGNISVMLINQFFSQSVSLLKKKIIGDELLVPFHLLAVFNAFKQISLCMLISTPDSETEEQYSLSIFHINNIYYMYLVKDVYMVLLIGYCLGVKLLSLPVPANN